MLVGFLAIDGFTMKFAGRRADRRFYDEVLLNDRPIDGFTMMFAEQRAGSFSWQFTALWVVCVCSRFFGVSLRSPIEEYTIFMIIVIGDGRIMPSPMAAATVIRANHELANQLFTPLSSHSNH